MSYPNPLFSVSYADLQNTKRVFANAKANRTLVFLYLIYIGFYSTPHILTFLSHELLAKYFPYRLQLIEYSE